MPEIFPKHYWLFHSLWHVLLAAGYYELYALIELDSNTLHKKAKKHSRTKQQTIKADEQATHVIETDTNLTSQAHSQVCWPQP